MHLTQWDRKRKQEIDDLELTPDEERAWRKIRMRTLARTLTQSVLGTTICMVGALALALLVQRVSGLALGISVRNISVFGVEVMVLPMLLLTWYQLVKVERANAIQSKRLREAMARVDDDPKA